jgi:hypothetical protein
MEKPEADNKRFFFTAGYFTNKEMVDIIRKYFPEYNDRLPGLGDEGGDYPRSTIARQGRSWVLSLVHSRRLSLTPSTR